MRTLSKIGKYLGIVLVSLVLIIGALVSLRAYLQHANAKAYVIGASTGINQRGYVKIGGIDQWVQIRGQDRANPVLLVLHGGPGATLTHLARLFLPWEKHFTVVQWDQRGAGKSLTASGATIADSMSVDRMTKDGIELAEHLRSRLGKDKITILGHSWGSILGMHMAKRRPDLFYAFVGTGQVADMPRGLQMHYADLLMKARAAGDHRTAQALAEIGPPPFLTRHKLEVFFASSNKYPPASDLVALKEIRSTWMSPPPDFSLRDVYDWYRGFRVVPSVRLYHEMLSTQLASLGPDFEIPVFFMHGTDDALTQVALAKRYFETIKASHKEMVLLEGGGHFAFLSMSDRFLAELVARVRPHATGGANRARR